MGKPSRRPDTWEELRRVVWLRGETLKPPGASASLQTGLFGRFLSSERGSPRLPARQKRDRHLVPGGRVVWQLGETALKLMEAAIK